jgi:competence protein ComEC
MKLIIVSLAWLIGIYLGSLIAPPLYAFLIAFILPLLLILLWRKKTAVLWAGIALIIFLGGVLNYQLIVKEPTLPNYYHHGVVELRGTVEKDPEFERGTQSFCFAVQELNIDGEWREVSGKVSIHTRPLPAYSYGDQLQVSGELQEADADYLTRQGISFSMDYPQAELLGRGWLFGLRNRLSQSLTSALPEPQSSLSQALLLGNRSHLPESITKDFRITGTAHLLAISGLHLSILAGIFLSLLAWLLGRRRPTYLLGTLAIIWLYAIISGMRPPVFRAAIMFSMLLIAIWLGRPRSLLPSLALAAAVMVGITPQILWQVSFQLSFAAIAGIALLMPYFLGWIEKGIGNRRGTSISILRFCLDSLSVTFVAIIFISPLIAYYFHYVSWVGLPTTFLALPAMPFAIMLSLIVAVLGLFLPPLAWAVGWLDWLFISYIIKVVHGWAIISPYQLGNINAAFVWLYYGALVAILYHKLLRQALSRPIGWVKQGWYGLAQFIERLPKKWALGILLALTVAIWLVVATTPPKQLEVSVIDVGQGDAILMAWTQLHLLR